MMKKGYSQFGIISTHFSPLLASFGSPFCQLIKLRGDPSDQTNPWENVESWFKPIHRPVVFISSTA